MSKPVTVQEQLKNSGIKSTKSRMAILSILHDKECPMAAEELFIELKNKGFQINLSTVYRTLEVLEATELITKIQILNDDRKLFEYNEVGHRHYLVCLSCKKLVTIHNCPLGGYDKHIEEETDFKILGHKLYLYGYCKECREKNVKDTRI